VSKVPHSAFIPLSNVWDSDTEILAYYCARWQDSGNPYHAWEAMDICARRKLAFPDWVRRYLDDCAQRVMDAAQSKASKDLREILPGVLGFSGERGRGHPLRPDGEASEYVTAAVVFANAIDEGSKPTDALVEASMVLDQPVADKIDSKTLLGHIKKLYGVTKAPRTNAGWKTLLNGWYREKLRPGKVFRELSP